MNHGCPDASGENGRVRLEAFQHNWGFSINGPYTMGSPFRTFVPTTPPPRVQVTGIAGISVPPSPTGSFDVPDVIFTSDVPVEVVVEGRQVPLGTVVQLHLFSLDGADQVIDMPPLEGTLEQSTTTDPMVTFPAGFTRGYVHASWGN